MTDNTDRQEFIDAATAQAFLVEDEESDDYGRRLIHCRGSFTGADWDLESVVKEIEKAEEVRWVESIFDHDLLVLCPNGRQWSFAVKNLALKPEVETEDEPVEDELEWGVMQESRPGLHRGPMSQDEAEAWVREFEEWDNGRPGAFYVVSRNVSAWKRVK